MRVGIQRSAALNLSGIWIHSCIFYSGEVTLLPSSVARVHHLIDVKIKGSAVVMYIGISGGISGVL